MTVSTSDIETALGRTLTDAELAQADQRIEDALIQIEGRLGDPALLNQRALDMVVREAVVTRFLNPEGREYEAIDDYRYGMPKETRRVTILDEWWDLLSPSRESNVFSARPQFVADTVDLSLDWS